MLKLASDIHQSGKFPVTSLLKLFITSRIKVKVDPVFNY